MTTACLIALGSSVGASDDVFADAMSRLNSDQTSVVSLSRSWDTSPIGGVAVRRFLNAAAIVHTRLAPENLLSELQNIELEFGRSRTVRWGDRTLDLDLLLFGTHVIWTRRLIVPHPAMWYRRFVLSSAAEVAGSWQHPLLKMTVGELWLQLNARPLRLCLEPQNSIDSTRTSNGIFGNEFTLPFHPDVLWTEQSPFARIQLHQSSPEHPRLSYPCPNNHPDPMQALHGRGAVEHGDESWTVSRQADEARTIHLFADHPKDAQEQLVDLTRAMLG